MMDFLDSFDDLEKAVERENVDPRFYYVYQKKLLTVLTGSLIANLVIFLFAGFLINSRPSPNIYLTTVGGKVTKITPMKEPILTREAVGEWSRDVLKTMYNFDHLQYAQQLEAGKQYFSPEAWDLFVKQFELKIKPELLDKKLLITSVPAKAVVKNEGTLNGNWSWVIEVPIETTWAGATGTEYVRMLANITVSKIQGDPRGIVITQFSIDRTMK